MKPNQIQQIKSSRDFFYETRTIDELDQAYLVLSLVPIFPVIFPSRPDLLPLGIRGWERTRGNREKPIGAM